MFAHASKAFSRALVAALTVALTMASTVFANDRLTSDASLVASGLQQSYSNTALAAGATASFSFSLYVEVQSGGSEPDYPILVDIETKPSWVTANTTFPITINGTGTGNAVSVSFTATGQAVASSGLITFRAIDNGAELGQNIINTNSQSDFSVAVSPPGDTTAPVIVPNVVGTVGNDGWYTSNVSLSWSVTDAQSSITSQTGCGTTTITADQPATTYTCAATSAGGTTSQSVSIKRDATAPTVNPASVLSTTWRNIDLAQAYTASDAGSGLANPADASFTLTASTESTNATTPTVATRTVYDVAGNSTTRSVSALIDKTAPTITDLGPTAGPDGDNDWYITAVTNQFGASDGLSGLPASFVTPFTVSSGSDEGDAVTINSGSVSDVAGNTNPGLDSDSFKVDLSDPTITFVSRTAANGAGWNNGAVTVTWSCSDAVSGAVEATVSDTVTTDGLNQTASATCTDIAGRTASDSVSGINIDTVAPTVNPGDVIDGTWRNTPLSETFSASDGLSGLASTADASFTLTASVESTRVLGLPLPTVVSRTVTDVAGNSTTRLVWALIDLTAPAVVDAQVPSGTAGANGWYVSAVTNQFSASDDLSGLAGGVTSPFTKSSGTAEGSAVTIASGSVSDAAGNTNPGVNSAAFKIDLSDPAAVAFVGGPAAGSSHYFGEVPSAPTCTATDGISGLAGCVVSGHGTTVGAHTMTATATDNAGRTASITRSYTVLAWTAKGFYAPVDMGGVLNTVKNGSTVPLKFELFAGSNELTDIAAIGTFKVTRRDCSTLVAGATDDIELYSTGGTTLRYDVSGGQFIQNWQVPKGAGVCYVVTMTADDGTSIMAYFKTK